MHTFPDAPGAHAIGVMVLTLAGLFLFSRKHISLESSGFAVLTVLIVGFELFPYEGAHGQLGPTDFLAGFGNPALVTIVALLVCSKALEVTGALTSTTRLLTGLWLQRPRAGLLVTMFGAATASMFMNNTPLVAILLPVLVAVCLQTQTATSTVLMPVGFATIIGGMATTIGTSTNLLVSDLVTDYGLPRFGMFDFALPVILAGSAAILLLWLITPVILPARAPTLTDTSPRLFRGVLHLTDSSAAVGKTLAEVRSMTRGRIQIERIERGSGLFIARLPTQVLRTGDRLYARGTSVQLKAYEEQLGATLRQGDSAASATERRWIDEAAQQRLAEIVVTTSSPLYGQAIGQAGLLTQFGLSPIAVHTPNARAGSEPEESNTLGDFRLRAGDVVLVQGEPSGISALKRSGLALVLSDAVDLPMTARALPAGVIMAGVIVVAALGILPIMISALIGVLLCLATRCLRWQQVHAAIDTNLVLMIVASLGLGKALTETGATAWLAGLFVALSGELSPGLVIAILMLAAALLTEIVTNNAAAVLLTPLAFGIAEGLGLDAKPLVLAVMFGANMSYLTPLGYQTNIIVMNAGGYQFADFFRLGLPLQFFIWALLSLLLAFGVGI